MTSDDHEKLIIRPKSNYDLSLPSGNSVYGRKVKSKTFLVVTLISFVYTMM